MKFFPFSRRLNPKMDSENSQTNVKLAEHHRTPKTKQQKSAKRSSALVTKQVAIVRQVSKRVPRCGAVCTAGPNTKFPPKIRSKNSWNWLFRLMSATIWQIKRFEVHAIAGIPAQKHGNHLLVCHKKFGTGTVCKSIFGLWHKIWTSPKYFGICKGGLISESFSFWLQSTKKGAK